MVIPARNEAENIGSLLAGLQREPETRITVVDGASSDSTAAVAQDAGVRVVFEDRVGKGFAATAGLLACDPGPVFLCDGDVTGIAPGRIEALRQLAEDRRAPVARMSIGRSPEDAPVTTLVARPLLAALGLAELGEPLGGLAVVDRDFALEQHLPGGWGFDVALTVAALAARGEVPELPVRGVSHRSRDLSGYVQMAEEVVVALLRARGVVDWGHEDCVLCHRVRGVVPARFAT